MSFVGPFADRGVYMGMGCLLAGWGALGRPPSRTGLHVHLSQVALASLQCCRWLSEQWLQSKPQDVVADLDLDAGHRKRRARDAARTREV